MVAGTVIELPYPNWRQLVPDMVGDLEMDVTPDMYARAKQAVRANKQLKFKYLGAIKFQGEISLRIDPDTFVKLVEALYRAGHPHIKLRTHFHNAWPSPMIVTAEDDPLVFGMLMPFPPQEEHPHFVLGELVRSAVPFADPHPLKPVTYSGLSGKRSRTKKAKKCV